VALLPGELRFGKHLRHLDPGIGRHRQQRICLNRSGVDLPQIGDRPFSLRPGPLEAQREVGLPAGRTPTTTQHLIAPCRQTCVLFLHYQPYGIEAAFQCVIEGKGHQQPAGFVDQGPGHQKHGDGGNEQEQDQRQCELEPESAVPPGLSPPVHHDPRYHQGQQGHPGQKDGYGRESAAAHGLSFR